MGMELTVTFPSTAPDWPAVAALLTRCGYPLQMRMIDGQLAFPDEDPPEAWRELRVAAEGEMVTLRRTPGGIACVTWGNADGPARRLWHAVAWALAATSGGMVVTDGGSADAAVFRRTAGLPESFVA